MSRSIEYVEHKMVRCDSCGAKRTLGVAKKLHWSLRRTGDYCAACIAAERRAKGATK